MTEVKQSRKILISSWGDFTGWSQVRYVYNDTQLVSAISDSIIIKSECIEPSDVMVFLLDTLLDKTWDLQQDLRDEGIEYKELFTDMTKKVRELLQSELQKYRLENVDDIKLRVVPGVGEYRTVEIQGYPVDVRYLMLYHLAKFLIDRSKDVSSLEIYLNITYGLNYATVLLYRALREIAELIALIKDIRIKVVNTIPYVKGVTNTLYFLLVEDLNILPRLEILWSEDFEYTNRIIQPLYKDRDFNKNFYISLRELLGENSEWGQLLGKGRRSRILAFWGSLINGLPLYISWLCPKTDLRLLMTRLIEETYYKNIDIIIKDVNGRRKAYINRKVRLTEAFTLLVKTYVVNKLLQDNKLLCIGGQEILSSGISLSDLKRFANSDFVKYSTNALVIQKEISELERLNKSERNEQDAQEKVDIPNEWISYGRLKGLDLSEGASDLNPRNLVAHGGFVYNGTEIRKYADDIWARIKPEFREKYENTLIDVLASLVWKNI